MSDFDAAIVGAGAAGIAAARRLHAAGRSVILVEAATRVGGRAWTETLDGMPLDLGCGWLHSADRNPLVPIAVQAGFTVDRSSSAWRMQYRDLGFSPAEQRAAGEAWAAFEQKLENDPPPSDCACDALIRNSPWTAYAQALSGYMNGASLELLSVEDFLAYEGAASDNNWRVREGYGSLIASLLPPVTLALATPVTIIDDDGSRVRLETPRGAIEAGAVIVTVSTNVLASAAIRFGSGLDEHLHAAANVPLGLADKLYIALTEPDAIEPETHLIGDPRLATTGSYYMRPLGHPVIEAFFGGQGAELIEREGLQAAFRFAKEQLAALLGADIRKVLKPIAATGWCRTDYVLGSYSHALPGQAAKRKVLARAAGRIHFAGEATHPTDFSTAHGAWASGERAADEVLAS